MYELGVKIVCDHGVEEIHVNQKQSVQSPFFFILLRNREVNREKEKDFCCHPSGPVPLCAKQVCLFRSATKG